MAPPTTDFQRDPLLVFFEVTRACALACRHCRASAQRRSDPHELSTTAACEVISQLTDFDRPPLLVLTGGDPLERPDLFELIRFARERGIRVAITPSATPLVTPQALAELRDAGVSRVAISLDGADSETHDSFRGWPGSFDRTLEILADARSMGISVQVNTTVVHRNMQQIDAIAELLTPLDIAMWSVFFLVPVGRGRIEQRLNAKQCEMVFARLWEQAKRQPYVIKTTEAHHYRRYILQHGGTVSGGRASLPMLGVNDGKGVMFISHTGEIFPSGFLPIECGRVPLDSIVDVYRRSTLFQALREPDGLQGKCGVCEFRNICGGSRARAYAVVGDPLASEPDCAYKPRMRHREAATC